MSTLHDATLTLPVPERLEHADDFELGERAVA
jgi:hypothetical protein